MKKGKKGKDCLTVLICVYSDESEKVNPFVIGKSKEPRCLSKIITLLLDYDANKNVWMTTEIYAR